MAGDRRMLLALAVVALAPIKARGQGVGDFVFPKSTPAAIKVGEEVAVEATITDYLVVEKAENGWLWVECKNLLAPSDEGKKGWIAAAVVDDLETQIDYFAGKAVENGMPNATGFFLAGAVASIPLDNDHQRRALNYFSRAMEVDGTVDYFYQRRASCHTLLKDYDAALADLVKARERLDPSNELVGTLMTTVVALKEGETGVAPPAPAAEHPSAAPLTALSDTAAPPAPAGGSGPTPTTDQRLIETLDAAGLEYTVLEGGDVGIMLHFEGGRSQNVIATSATESIGDFEIREIWSPIAQTSDAEFSQHIADKLLRVGSQRKIGAVEVVTLNDKPTAYFTAKVPAVISAPRLREFIDGVAGIADDLEQSLFNADSY